MKIIFIADFFVEQILGGGELNNDELLKMLVQDGHEVLKINSHLVAPVPPRNSKNEHQS